MLREPTVEERLRLLEKEIASLGKELANLRLRLMAETEAEGVDIAALKQYLARAFPDFRRRYPRIREWVLQENQLEAARSCP